MNLNFDGIVKGGFQVGGGVLKNFKWQTQVAFVGPLTDHIVNQVRGMLLLWGLRVANNLGYTRLDIEGDSKIIIDVVENDINAGRKVVLIL